MDTRGLKTGDRCKVKIDWAKEPMSGYRVQICKFQENGTQTFAKVRWLGGKSKELTEQYGTLFNVKHELVKVG